MIVIMPRTEIRETFKNNMNIAISGSHIDLTDALQNHVDSEFAKIEKLIDPHARITVEIGKTTEHHKQGNIFKAEAKIVEPKAEYFATIISDDLYTAIGMLSDELSEQITRSKDRQRTLFKRGSAMIKKLLRFE